MLCSLTDVFICQHQHFVQDWLSIEGRRMKGGKPENTIRSFQPKTRSTFSAGLTLLCESNFPVTSFQAYLLNVTLLQRPQRNDCEKRACQINLNQGISRKSSRSHLPCTLRFFPHVLRSASRSPSAAEQKCGEIEFPHVILRTLFSALFRTLVLPVISSCMAYPVHHPCL